MQQSNVRKTPTFSLILTAMLVLIAGLPQLKARDRSRTPVRIPDVPGFLTLKCDFHIHTVFSDGKVWPDIRAEEAWRVGLDAIAITDHIEYQPHKHDISTNHNRGYEIARSLGDELEVIVIHGSEVTRDMPPGHLNAIFLSDSHTLATRKWQDALEAAHKQNAFIFWNHPGWKAQQPDGVARWYPEHTKLPEQDMLHGIEVVNQDEYYPEAHQWCLEKNLAMLANSDIHAPFHFDYDPHLGEHRPITLVFARERSAAGIKDALLDRRTAVYTADRLIGREKFVKPLFERSNRLLNAPLAVKPGRRAYLQIQNESDVRYELELRSGPEGVTLPSNLVLPPGRTALCEVRLPSKAPAGPREVRAEYSVKNVLVAPEEPLIIHLSFGLQVTGN